MDWIQFILPELEGPLDGEESWTKAVDALSEKGPAVIPSLLMYLDIKAVPIRWILERAFQKIGSQYLKDIHSFVQKDEMEKRKRVYLLHILGDIGNRESQKIFLRFLDEEDASLQALALRGLYRLKESPSVGDAHRLSESRSRDVRRYLCLSLRSGQKPEFIPVFLRLLNDDDFNVRFAASEALEVLSKSDVTFSYP